PRSQANFAQRMVGGCALGGGNGTLDRGVGAAPNRCHIRTNGTEPRPAWNGRATEAKVAMRSYELSRRT
ncbi:MAG TPA: hypothetical protein VGF59_22440, partial [Bryobacteraceae bacterium]